MVIKMSKTKSYVQLKADLARIAEQEAAIKKRIAETEKKQKEVAAITLGKTILAYFSDEDLLCKSSADLRQFANALCEKAVANDEEDESEDMTDEGVSDDEEDDLDEDEEESETDEEESESLNKNHRPYNPIFGAQG